jgi:hypothetical protein
MITGVLSQMEGLTPTGVEQSEPWYGFWPKTEALSMNNSAVILRERFTASTLRPINA